MRIECKNCNAVYRVDSSKFPTSGKKVRCTNCNNTWMHVPSQDNIDHPEKDYINKEHATNPNLQSNKNTILNNSTKSSFLVKKISSIVAMILLVFSLSVMLQNNMPYKIRKIYRIIEMYDTTNIQLANSQIKILKNNKDSIAIKVEGVIKNQSDQERFIPGIHFVFYNKQKKAISSEKLNKHKTDIIPSKEDYKFEHIIQYVPKETDSIQIKIGNLFEIAFL
ncbi:MJ0042 family finger-like domain protein [Ehrlichia chaffeensis str. Heartland]|uniref:Zinc finger-like domain protein n=1 Tax=Ehrlichia chaffeensis (strain ATCC CRL-10679 / Arkansas) TaxID=205920 RepID=Q2GI45_EHRCR|nr:zinc-ribbon domain-containing protein [Ehrlichia chaffeensis]ABD44730.1 zinc finger-like domain protein [Ehrlichia chaffeensis str. Arkansas]AHX04126.1 MJ0042 family finger-like domain protein [Ehrlichia chaffeensis str. Heartland]AHX07052.1 MJ0042 family finger-like domain protein [Ehrlichia chaffeensis str. Liberty]AHX08104.1 MJ0042 family finger-like domain protein [Ehrlichia chaffeensis str. Saint Vincent]AHX09553.1 MJ0042 family finger-like domain protein [Ehrlichia chaffeensis str. Wa